MSRCPHTRLQARAVLWAQREAKPRRGLCHTTLYCGFEEDVWKSVPPSGHMFSVSPHSSVVQCALESTRKPQMGNRPYSNGFQKAASGHQTTESSKSVSADGRQKSVDRKGQASSQASTEDRIRGTRCLLDMGSQRSAPYMMLSAP